MAVRNFAKSNNSEAPVSIVPNLISLLPELPLTHLVVLVALAGLALAAFAIHAVLTIAKRRAP
jgi:hypothetical protein